MQPLIDCPSTFALPSMVSVYFISMSSEKHTSPSEKGEKGENEDKQSNITFEPRKLSFFARIARMTRENREECCI
jgi:hypothetical protein